jgi:hypothetical protein
MFLSFDIQLFDLSQPSQTVRNLCFEPKGKAKLPKADDSSPCDA